METLEPRLLLSTVQVTTIDDVSDGDTSSIAALIASPGTDGFISLREAISAANNTPGLDEITFDSALDGLAIVLSGTANEDGNFGGDLDITDGLIVIGNGVGKTVLDGNQNDRIFDVVDPKSEVVLQGMTITNGRVDGNQEGGGVRSLWSGVVKVKDSLVIGNTAAGSSSYGGGLFVKSNTLEVVDSVVSGNTVLASGRGGGISVTYGTLIVTGSTVTGNQVSPSSIGGGGGIYGDHGSVFVRDSLIVGNVASNGGGLNQNSGSLTIINSTVSGNSSLKDGGGVQARSASVSIRNSTLTDNTSDSDGTDDGSGGAIRIHQGSFTLFSSIITGNFQGMGGKPHDIGQSGVTPIGSHNLIGDPSTSGGFTDGVNHNIVGTDPMLDSLADNGGKTQTHALLPGSPAIDAGFATRLTTDQRSGFRRFSGLGVDIGAFEVQPGFAAANIRGFVFVDLNADGDSDINDFGQRSVTLFLDDNGNGSHDPGEESTTSDSTGFFAFSGLAAGTYRVRQVLASGFEQTTGTSPDVVLAADGEFFDMRFGNTFVGDLIVDSGSDGFGGGGGSGRLGLREAILISEEREGADVIRFDPSLFSSGPVTVVLSGGEFLIQSDLSLIGPGPDLLIIDANHASRIFNIDDGRDEQRTVLIEGMTIANGNAPGNGGGIVNAENLTLRNSVVTGNSTPFAGGGIGSPFLGPSSTLTVIDSTVSNNTTSGHSGTGGGILAYNGHLNLISSTVSGNQTTGHIGAMGGGIGVEDATATILNSSIINNSTAGKYSYGGGLSANGATVVVSNTTISGNQTTGEVAWGGGAIARNGGKLLVTNSTVTGNQTLGTAAIGAGLFNKSGTLQLSNTIVAGNTAVNTTGNDLSRFGGSIALNHSLIGDNEGSGLASAPLGSPDANGNLIGTNAAPIDPLLGPLADNGGPTLTHALLPGSPGINAGNNTLVAPDQVFDQRGAGFPRVVWIVDMGAVEDDSLVTGSAGDVALSGDRLARAVVPGGPAARLNLDGGNTGTAGISLVTFDTSNPTDATLGVPSAFFFDLRVAGSVPGELGDASVTATFPFPDNGTAPTLHYYDTNTGAFVTVPADALTVNHDTHTVTVVFDASSSPAITDLSGTVFATSAGVVAPLPQLISFGRIGRHNLLSVPIDGNLDAASATDPDNYQLVHPGRDRRFDTRDDRTYTVDARYSPGDGTTPSTLILDFRGRLRRNTTLRLTVDNVTDDLGTPLDGQPFTRHITVGKRIRSVDADGDRFAFRVRGGLVTLVQDAGFNVLAMRIDAARPHRPAQLLARLRAGGNGSVHIENLSVGPDSQFINGDRRGRNGLAAPLFTVGPMSFSQIARVRLASFLTLPPDVFLV